MMMDKNTEKNASTKVQIPPIKMEAKGPIKVEVEIEDEWDFNFTHVKPLTEGLGFKKEGGLKEISGEFLSRQSFEKKDGKGLKENRDPRDHREGRENRIAREIRDLREIRDGKDAGEARDLSGSSVLHGTKGKVKIQNFQGVIPRHHKILASKEELMTDRQDLSGFYNAKPQFTEGLLGGSVTGVGMGTNFERQELDKREAPKMDLELELREEVLWQKRLLAGTIDGLCLMIIAAGVFGSALFFAFGKNFQKWQMLLWQKSFWGLSAVFVLALALSYFAIGEASSLQTIGKRCFGLRVGRGRRQGLWQAGLEATAVRGLVGIGSLVLLGIPFVWKYHERLSDTVLLDMKSGKKAKSVKSKG
jgi:uncharacterized RDD family membrane protein YckC